jgi:hypothetical protein
MRKLRMRIGRLVALVAIMIFPSVPKDGKWHHQAFTIEWWGRSGKKVVGYLDGFEVAE